MTHRHFTDRHKVRCFCGMEIVLLGNDWQPCECGVSLRVTRSSNWSDIRLESMGRSSNAVATPMILEAMPPEEVK